VGGTGLVEQARDVFRVYISDRLVLLRLSRRQIAEVGDGSLSLVRAYIRDRLSYRSIIRTENEAPAIYRGFASGPGGIRTRDLGMVAHMCRNVWKPAQGTPAFLAAGFKTREKTFDGSR
jgi:hypothetical protein